MADEVKKYYWLKFQKDFFRSKRIKKLRRLPDGDTLLAIYMQMQLNTLETGGVMEYTGVEDSFTAEVALEIDEDEELVGRAIDFMLTHGLLIARGDNEYFMPYVADNTGSETASTQRSRECRAKQKAAKENDDLLHCNTIATPLQQNATPLQQIATQVQQPCSVEKEKEKEKELEIEKEGIGEKRARFIPPTLDQVADYCFERQNSVDPQRFLDFYESKGWYVGKNKMKDWKAAVRTWENDAKRNQSGNNSKTLFQRIMEA